MECKRTSHGNLACGDNTKLKIDQEEKHSDEDREKISKDFEMFEMIIKRQGVSRAEDILQKIIDDLFGHLNEEEGRELALAYVGGTNEEKEVYEAQFGKPYLQYFLSGLRGVRRRNHHSARFTDFMVSLRHEDSVSDGLIATALKQKLEIASYARGLNLRPCPMCFVPIEKDGGCNHMHCTHCEAHFCWYCEQDIQICTATSCARR